MVHFEVEFTDFKDKGPLAIINLFIGLLLLALGRRLFWLFVGCIGFVVGSNYSIALWGLQADWVILVIALFAGFFGALLAIFFQGLAIGLSGFFAGGYIAIVLMNMSGFGSNELFWIIYLIGGIIGAVLVAVLFGWALILLSSIIGAALIVQTLSINPTTNIFIFIFLFIIGFLFQTRLSKTKSTAPK